MKGSIYIIRSFQTDDVYYGSTTQMLCKRMASHRQDSKCWLNDTGHYISSFDILHYDDAYIELVEEIEFQNKQELRAREGHYIRDNNCVNKVIPCRTQKQYREEHMKDIQKWTKQNYVDNKKIILEKNKNYIENHKQERKEYMLSYREANKEKIKEQQKQADRRYKDKLKEARRLKRESKKIS